MKKAILLLVWGAGNVHARSEIMNFEKLCATRFPGWNIRWAFTSSILRNRLAYEHKKSDSTIKALWRLHYERFEMVAIQPLQVIPGREYQEACEAIDAVGKETALHMRIGKPLLAGNESMEEIGRHLLAHLPSERRQSDNVIFVGHGAKHTGGAIYEELNATLSSLDRNAHIGLLSGQLALENILPNLVKRPVWLQPLLATIGKHTLQDMAGNNPQSWRGKLEAAGFVCHSVVAGLLKSPGLCNIWLTHLRQAIMGME